MKELAERIVNTMNEIHGVHSGHRAVHAKGSCCKGTFVATPEVAQLCVAAHLQGAEVPVTVRFSSGSGKPTRADGAHDERGMAVRFHLPGDAKTDIVSLTLPAFFVRTPEDFLELLEAQVPEPDTGKPDMERISKFVEAHPETQLAIGYVMMTMAPASFAGCTFNGIHAFLLTGPDGSQRYVRYRWVPDAEPATLTDPETRALGKDYLQEELERRLAEGPIGFELRFQLAETEDDTTDPTTPWPEERTWVIAGRMTLNEFAGKDCEPMIFDPGNVTEGIERSDDKILHMRSPAYGVSFERRTASSS